MNVSPISVVSKSPIVSPPQLVIDDDAIIRQDINNPTIKRLYNLSKKKSNRLDSVYNNLNDIMDEEDKKVFFNQLRNYYYPDGFFTTERVADKGFTEKEIQEITHLLVPFSKKLSRKGKPIGGKKTRRRITKKRRSNKKRLTKKRR